MEGKSISLKGEDDEEPEGSLTGRSTSSDGHGEGELQTEEVHKLVADNR